MDEITTKDCMAIRIRENATNESRENTNPFEAPNILTPTFKILLNVIHAKLYSGGVDERPAFC